MLKNRIRILEKKINNAPDVHNKYDTPSRNVNAYDSPRRNQKPYRNYQHDPKNT